MFTARYEQDLYVQFLFIFVFKESKQAVNASRVSFCLQDFFAQIDHRFSSVVLFQCEQRSDNI